MFPGYGPIFYHYSPYGYENDFYDPYYDEMVGQRVFGPWGAPPYGPPGQSPGAGGAPTTPPPAFTPAQTQQAGAFAVDPGAIRRCLFRFTYVWLTNRQQFWFYPTFVGRRSISGYRWNGFRWVFYGTDLRRIQSFQCV